MHFRSFFFRTLRSRAHFMHSPPPRPVRASPPVSRPPYLAAASPPPPSLPAMPRGRVESMEQDVFVVIASWLVGIPSTSRCSHLPRWQLGNAAYELLFFTTAASTPSRSSAVTAALRLFVLSSRAELDDMQEQAAAVERRVQRALLRAGVQLDPRRTVVDWVRQFAREFEVERTISRYARTNGRGPPQQAHAVRLHSGLMEMLQVDADSASQDEMEDLGEESQESSSAEG